MAWVHLENALDHTGHTPDELVTVSIKGALSTFKPAFRADVRAMRALKGAQITVAEFMRRWPRWCRPEWGHCWSDKRGQHGTPGQWTSDSGVTLTYSTPDGPPINPPTQLVPPVQREAHNRLVAELGLSRPMMGTHQFRYGGHVTGLIPIGRSSEGYPIDLRTQTMEVGHDGLINLTMHNLDVDRAIRAYRALKAAGLLDTPPSPSHP